MAHPLESHPPGGMPAGIVDLVAPFSADEAYRNRMDWLMFQNGPVHIVRPDVFDSAAAWFECRGYETVVLNAERWGNRSRLAADFVSMLDLQDWNANNFDALNDCLSDVAWGEGVMHKSSLGLCLAIARLTSVEVLFGDDLDVLLRCFEEASRTAALFGKSMDVVDRARLRLRSRSDFLDSTRVSSWRASRPENC